MFTDMAGKL